MNKLATIGLFFAVLGLVTVGVDWYLDAGGAGLPFAVLCILVSGVCSAALPRGPWS